LNARKSTSTTFSIFGSLVSPVCSAALFDATISYEKSSSVPHHFYMRDYEHYANADILPWESRQYNTSLLQSNCHGNPVRYEL
jgi:hypothetical protein